MSHSLIFKKLLHMIKLYVKASINIFKYVQNLNLSKSIITVFHLLFGK